MRSVAVVALSVMLLAVSYGAVSVSFGLPWWIPVLLSVLVVAGASEIMFVSIIGIGGSPLLAAAAGLMVNARHVPYGFQAAPFLGHGWRSWIGTYAINDESTALALAGRTPAARRFGFWSCGLAIIVVWPLGTLLGTAVGTFLGDVNAFGLDAVFPAMILALVIPQARKAGTLVVAAVAAGAVITIATSPWLPAGLPELLSLGALVIAKPWETRTKEAAATQ